jgi:DNA repair protein RecO (recombination protein O)
VAERARVYKTDGVIIRRRNSGEADSILTVFSESEGKFDAVARGVRKARSHMRGHLEPLTFTRMLIARGRHLDVFTQAETLNPYRAIREDLDRTAVALYCAELVDHLAAERVKQPEVFHLLLETLDALEAGAESHVARLFEVQLLAEAGYQIQLDACASCGERLTPEPTLLSPPAGGLVCIDCRAAAATGRLVSLRGLKVLRYARGATVAEFAALRIDEGLAHELRQALGDVIRHTIDRDPNTNRYLDELSRQARNALTPA